VFSVRYHEASPGRAGVISSRFVEMMRRAKRKIA
jgi:hypothetical protein